MAQFDVSMYRQNPLRSVADYENDFLRNDVQRGLLQRNQLLMQGEQADLATKQRAIELDNQLREVGREFGDNPQANAELIFSRTGNIKAAQDYLKSTADIGHVNAQTANSTANANKTSYEQRVAQADKAIMDIGALRSVDEAKASIASHLQKGDIDFEKANQLMSSLPQNPAEFPMWQQNMIKGIMGAKDRLGLDLQQQQEQRRVTEFGITSGENIRHNKAAEGIQIRGQDLVDARTRELAALRREEVDAGKIDKVEAKRLDDVDRKVTKYSETLQKHGIPEFEDSLKNLEGVFSEYKKGDVPGVGKAIGLVPAWLQGQEAERVNQAIAEVKNVLLKARSGAAVTDSELKRFVEELGTGGLRSEATVRLAVDRIRKRFDKVKTNAVAGVSDDVKATYEERGGTVIPRAAQEEAAPVPPPVQTGPYGDAEKERRYQEWKAKQK